ncbi:hypothetical protein TNCT_248331 [Trichonephila clavata]|uniref:Uncharacterized protein n=1 Tax=Trichonephila clavata TaxID=2740835 RepID=A0A8X6J9B2_TRICU|nr:hypothetical protein TNCT_248331 [Trichonephila clavata]
MLVLSGQTDISSLRYQKLSLDYRFRKCEIGGFSDQEKVAVFVNDQRFETWHDVLGFCLEQIIDGSGEQSGIWIRVNDIRSRLKGVRHRWGYSKGCYCRVIDMRNEVG